MGSWRQELLDAARAAVKEDLMQRLPLAGRSRQFAVVLGGSAVTDDCDEYSGCDLIVFRVAGRREGSTAKPAQGTYRWQSVRHGPHHYRFTQLDIEAFWEAVRAADDSALYLLRHGEVIHDPQKRLGVRWDDPPAVPPEVWTQKLAVRYRAFRQRRASLAWCLRRGQPVAVLDNLRLLLEHGLSCCFYLGGEPAPARKWIFRGALRTEAGRVLRAPVLDLLSSLGELTVLGGSRNLRQNRLYQGVSRVQDALEALFLGAGLPVPGLAVLAPDAKLDVGETLRWEGAEWSAPRLRAPRRPGRAAATLGGASGQAQSKTT